MNPLSVISPFSSQTARRGSLPAVLGRGIVLFALGLPLLLGWAATAGYGQGAGATPPTGKKPQIAVWEFTLTDMEKSDGRAIANTLRSALVNTRVFRVMTRDQIDTLLGEQALGQTLIDAKEAIKAGKLKGVKYVVTGSLISIRGAFQATFEMIDGGSGEIIHSITPRTFRGDFLDFLDMEVPKIAGRMAGVEKGDAVAVAPPPPPPPPEKPVVEAPKRKLYIPPGRFSGTGARFYEKEFPKLVRHLQAVVAKEFKTFEVIRPFATERAENPKVEKMRRKDLRGTIWSGFASLTLGDASPNLGFVQNLAPLVDLDAALFLQASTSLFSGGDSGDYSIILYSPSSSYRVRRKGNFDRARWKEDFADGMRILLKNYVKRP